MLRPSKLWKGGGETTKKKGGRESKLPGRKSGKGSWNLDREKKKRGQIPTQGRKRGLFRNLGPKNLEKKKKKT